MMLDSPISLAEMFVAILARLNITSAQPCGMTGPAIQGITK